MTLQFQKATKTQARLRMALIGPSGSGKTYSALNIGQHLGDKVALVDTEHGSASKYAGIFTFDVLELDTFSPLTYVEAIHAAEHAGYNVLIIDSLSHAWMGKEGALEQVDKAAKRSQSKNTYTAWRDVTPMHNSLIDAILQSSCHVIVTMRAKTEYVLEDDDKGKKVPRKIGMAPIQRDGMEYEFDVVGDMTLDNELIVAKSRCPELSGLTEPKPGKKIADLLRAWLSDGTTATVKAPVQTTEQPAAPEMDLETAKAETNSEGKKYGELDSAILTKMSDAIKKALAQNGLTQEQRDEYQYKQTAIKTILASRGNH